MTYHHDEVAGVQSAAISDRQRHHHSDQLVGSGWVRRSVGSQRATDEYLLHPTRPWLKADLARTDGSAQIDLTFYEIVADFWLSLTR